MRFLVCVEFLAAATSSRSLVAVAAEHRQLDAQAHSRQLHQNEFAPTAQRHNLLPGQAAHVHRLASAVCTLDGPADKPGGSALCIIAWRSRATLNP
jgi:hypothetical protein